MATINGMYIFVEDEEVSFGVEVAEHTVESGIEISDHVKRQAVTLSLKGEIVGKNADGIRTKLKQMHQTGVLCKFSGRTSLSNCLITDFTTSHSHTIWGGCAFSMTLKEIRTATTSYVQTSNKKKDTKKTGTQQTVKKSKEEYVYHTVKKGDIIWALVASAKAPYKQYGMSCDEVMSANSSAFSKKGDFTTLQIGKKIIVGKR